ncbi:phosphotransferase family protein [Paenibacillus chitinolyticus]|uniref:phosphotransferase family protein n=1 Tax=Paenibacillus chitinolyticus TaxID=79263 RepID=UPI0036DB253A
MPNINVSLIDGLAITKPIVERFEISVYHGEYQDREVAIKIFSKSSPFYRECDSIHRLNKKGIPVPELIKTYEIEGNYVMISQWIDAQPLKEKWISLQKEQKEIYLNKIGILLAQVQFALSHQEIANSSFWQRNNIKDFSFFSWNSYLLEQLKKWTSRLKLSEVDLSMNIETIIKRVVQKASAITEPPRLTLIHSDFTMRNILCDESNKLWSIDFESTLAGDPLFDVARITWIDFEKEDVKSLVNSWEKETSICIDYKVLKLYQLIIAISVVSWVDKLPEVNHDNIQFRKKGIDFLLLNGGFIDEYSSN